MSFGYVKKSQVPENVTKISNMGHNRALGELFNLLCRNLEIEAWEEVHDWLYKHKDMGKFETKSTETRVPKANPPPIVGNWPTVLSFSIDFFNLLFALRQRFRSLAQDSSKRRVEELCKQLYCYSFFLKEKSLKLSGEDIVSLPGRLGVGAAEIPYQNSTDGFDKWIRGFDDDVN